MSNLGDAIAQQLTETFSPTQCQVQDDSALHAGHQGNSGGGHFSVHIVSDVFEGKNRIQRHRCIYDALAAFIPSQVHALAITALTPSESVQ